MVFFKINKRDIKRPRRSMSQREQHVLKLEIQDRLKRENHSCAFKPERKPAQKEGIMQFRYKGTNNSGQVVCEREMQKGTAKVLYRTLEGDLQKYPTAIAFEIMVIRSDPEVVEIKQRMMSMCNAHHALDAEDLVETLFNNFNIKPKGKDNA